MVGVNCRRVSAQERATRDGRKLTDDGDAVQGSDGADVVGGSDGTTDRRLLLLSAVLDALAGEVGSTALACLQARPQLVNMLPRKSTAQGGSRRRT